jgi:NitT/TauT family transport system permease protein
VPELTLSAARETQIPPTVKRPAGSRWSWAFLIDVAVFLFVFAAIFGVYAIGRSWLGPVHPQAQISQDPRVLPLYAFHSLVRISVAYALSLVFALAYGYVAASSHRAEIIMVPLLDILQSIPVLSFLPGVMLAMVAIFPHSQFGVELGSILLIFTGQVWNIAFSFYSSLKTIPRELNEAAIIYRFGRWQRFAELDLPFSTIGLVWNSMMSVAGGWFFLMACEMFVLGKRDFRIPGLGSFLQTAASHGDTRAILWGVAAMITVIVLLDQLVWRPIIVWADKFKFEQVESSGASQTTLLNLIGRASIVLRLYRLLLQPIFKWLTLTFTLGARRAAETFSTPKQNRVRRWIGYLLAAGVLIGLGFAVFHAARELSGLHREDYRELLESAALTFLRVNTALILGALWTVPRGRGHRFESSLGAHSATAGADGRFHPRHRALSHYSSFSPPPSRRPRNCRDAVDAARHAVVHPFQRDRRRHGHSHGPQGSRANLPLRLLGSLAVSDSAGHFSVSRHRDGDCIGRGVERQHRGGIFSLPRENCFDARARQHHQQRQ